ARCVRVLVRGASLAASMSSYLSSRLEADPGVTIEDGAEVSALHGAEHLEAVSIRNVKTGETRVVETRPLFVMGGAAPNIEWLSGLVKLDEKGFVIAGTGDNESLLIEFHQAREPLDVWRGAPHDEEGTGLNDASLPGLYVANAYRFEVFGAVQRADFGAIFNGYAGIRFEPTREVTRHGGGPGGATDQETQAH